jgi:predicted TIM-barrel fold metal-dependent hydrolase
VNPPGGVGAGTTRSAGDSGGTAEEGPRIKQLRAVSQHKNVYCKVSALYGRVKEQPAPQDIAYYTPLLDLAWECFGEDRLVFGSDWPVSETSGNYASVVKLTKAYFTSKGRSVSEKLFFRNALRFYGLGEALNSAERPNR